MRRPRWWSRRPLLKLSVGAVLVALPWLALVPSNIYRGVAVIERCDGEIKQRFGDDVEVIQGQERVRWFPPSWRCPATNGRVVHIWP